MTVETEKEPVFTAPQKGNVTLILDLKNVGWDDLADLIRYLQGNPLGAVVEVHVGQEVFDA